MVKKIWLCPECGSDNIHYDIGSLTTKPFTIEANRLIIGSGFIRGRTALDVYVCGDCGAVRTFISEQDALNWINDNWPKLNEEQED